MKKKWLILIIIILSTIFIALVWQGFFYSKNCNDLDCFQKSLAQCSRAKYINSANWSYEYQIKGENGGECEVRVTLLFAGLEPKFDSIAGESMTCFMPLRMVDFPEKNIDYCSGKLKENLQYLIIKDLYTYAAQNLGK